MKPKWWWRWSHSPSKQQIFWTTKGIKKFRREHIVRAIKIGEPCMVAQTRGLVYYIACVSQALHGWGPVGLPIRRVLERLKRG